MTFSKYDLQIFWMLGTLERLASLGMITPLPLAPNPGGCELFYYLDAKKLFPGVEDVREVLHDLIETFSMFGWKAPSQKDLEGVEFLVTEYIENPLKLTRFYLEKKDREQ